MTHILILTPGFPTDEYDLSCIPPIQDFIIELIKKYPDFYISVITIHYPLYKSSYIWNGIKVYSCGGKSRGHPVRILYWIKAIIKALIINNSKKINVIHTFWLNENAVIGTIISRLLKVRHINTIMGQDAKSANKIHNLINLNKIYKVTLSEYQSECFYNAYKRKSDTVIPWGVEELKLLPGPRLIDVIGVGSFISVKNFKMFIEVVSEIKVLYPEVNCVLVGEGEERVELERMIKSHGIENNLKFTGHLRRESVIENMKNSKILLHTSEYESFGLVIAEALSAGCYVVSKEIGCAKASRKIFTANDKKEMAEIIINLLNNGKDYSAENLFPISNTAKKYAELYFTLSHKKV